MRQPPRVSRWILLVCGLVAGVSAAPAFAKAPPQVVVVRDAGWSAGDERRAGASELMVLLHAARLRQHEGGGALVAVGDRRGRFSDGAEAALEQAVLHGVPVVKLAAGGERVANPHGLFLDGGALTPEAAQAVLARCLDRYGACPAPGELTPRLRAHLDRLQHELTLAGSPRLATR